MLNLPSSISVIESYAFYNCFSFSGELIIHDKIKNIEESTFYNCYGFSGLVLPNGLERIEENSFYNCYGMQNDLIIPISVSFIGKMSFYECNGFDKMILNSEVVLIEEQAFLLTRFSVVTYTGTRQPFCSSGTFPQDQEFSFTEEYNYSEICGIKLYSDDKHKSDSRTKVIVIVLCCVSSVIVAVLVAIIIWMRRKDTIDDFNSNFLNSEPLINDPTYLQSVE